MQNNNIIPDKLNTDNISDQNNISVSDIIPENNNSTSSEYNTIPDNTVNQSIKISYTGKGKGSNPNSRKNLISLADRTEEERKELGRKGGLKSGEKRQERKTMRETILEMLSETISDDMIEEYGLAKILKKPGGKSYQDAIIGAALLGAMNGDCKALQILRDTMGEMPTVKTENTTEIITKEDTDMINNLKEALIS